MNRLFKSSRRLINLESYASPVYNISSPSKYVLHVEINRPEAKNAMNNEVWMGLQKIMDTADKDPKVRAILFSSVAEDDKPVFSAGIDIGELSVELMKCMQEDDGARRFFKVRDMIKRYQEPITSIESCKKPVVAAVSGAAVGGAIDLLSACDIRYCDKNAWFSIKEVDVGLAADVGTLQRITKICGNESTTRELAFTGRKFDSQEAFEIGFVSSVADTREIMMDRCLEVCKTIAQKSPVAVQGTKVAMNYARDHSIADGLEQIATWNGGCLLTEDLMKSAMAMKERKGPEDVDYSDL